LVGYDILKIPSLVSIEWPFWNPKTLSKEPYLLSATLEVNRFVSFGNWGPSLTIRPRPEVEMVKLLKLCRARTGAWTTAAASRDIYRPGMNWFGFTWAPPECSTPKNLAILDELLTPGSLRDIVHLTRLAQAVYDEESEEQRDHKLDGLMEWLDTLPEIERKCLAAEINAWAKGNKGLGLYGYHVAVLADLRYRAGDPQALESHEQRMKQFLLDHPLAAPYYENYDKRLRAVERHLEEVGQRPR
jgi:hypothetical protein